MLGVTAGPRAPAATAAGEEAARAWRDEAAFRAFYERTARPLWAYLARSTGDRNLADDLVQEAYLRFLRSGFEGENEEHRKNYLFRIATNLMRDHYRRPRPEDPVGEPESVAAAAVEVAVEDAGGRRVRLRRDLERVWPALEPRDRRLLWLAHVEEASHREIAAALGVKEASVRVLVFRARQKLARLLGERGLGPEVMS
jgi:RNA polymerase sigma-70 factor (ECF subfamily)